MTTDKPAPADEPQPDIDTDIANLRAAATRWCALRDYRRADICLSIANRWDKAGKHASEKQRALAMDLIARSIPTNPTDPTNPGRTQN